MEHCAFFPASPRAMLFDNQIPCPFHPPGTVRHIVGHYLDMCPKRPKIGRRTASDTVSELCSTTVRFSLKGCPKFGSRTVPNTLSDIPSTCVRKVRKSAVGHLVRLYLNMCPMCPESLQKCNFRSIGQPRTHCRT